MTTECKKLNERMIDAAKKDIRDKIVPGLLLRVGKTSKSFVLYQRFPGSTKPERRTIGKVGAISLAKARETAQDWLKLIAAGEDPAKQVERKRQEADRQRKDTVAAVAETYLAKCVIGPEYIAWISDARPPDNPIMRQWRRVDQIFRDILIPLFGHCPIAELTHGEVLDVLDKIEQHGTDHAMVDLKKRDDLRRPNRKRGPAPKQARVLFVWLDQMLRWAASVGRYGIEFSPLLRVSKKGQFGQLIKRDRVLSEFEIATVWRASATLRTPYRQFYRLLMLTGVRFDELRKAKWSEMNDLEWTIPAKRMKGKNGIAKKHIVPLTSHMRDLIKSIPRGTRGLFVFSVNDGLSPICGNGKTKIMLDEAICADLRLPASVLRRENYDPEATDRPMQHFTNHDLRRTLRTMIEDLGVSFHVGEAMLAHIVPGTAGHYQHSKRLIERRKAHEKWGKHLIDSAARERGKVVRMTRQAAE
jgi:integrase